MDKRIKIIGIVIIIAGLFLVYFQYIGPVNERIENKLNEHWFDEDKTDIPYREGIAVFKVDKDLGVDVYLSDAFEKFKGEGKGRSVLEVIDKFIENQSARGVTSITYWYQGSVYVP